MLERICNPNGSGGVQSVRKAGTQSLRSSLGRKNEALGPGSHAKWVCWSHVFQMNRPIQVKPAASEGRGGNFPV